MGVPAPRLDTMPMASPTRQRLTLNRLGEVPQAQATLVALAESRGFTKEAVFAIRLALDEALSNAVRHGNGNDPTRTVTVECDVSDDRFACTICDEGPGFRPDALPDPTDPAYLERPHGRGVMLMQAYMTEVSFNERGNCVTLVKDRGCTRPKC